MRSKVFKSRLLAEKVCYQLSITFLVFPTLAFADFQGSIQSLITSFLSGILPAFVMYEAGLAGFAYARKNPDAKEKAEATAIGALAVLGINGVWAYVKSHVR